jgi:hypothetical protein
VPRLLVVVLAALALSCDSTPAPVPTPGIATRAQGWLRGDLHNHTDVDGGFDTLATVIKLAEYLGTDEWGKAHPEYLENGLDFLVISDHRSVAMLSDPAFTSQSLILVGGEEFGSPGHAIRMGISEHVDHDPDDDGVTVEDLEAAIAATHAAGGIFSINHPMLPGIPWPWDTRDIDAMEVWNSGFGLGDPTYTAADLEAWEADHGPASPIFARAAQRQGGSASVQGLVLYEALLSRGVHVALVGGSDRHVALLPGFPTTWIRAATPDVAGLLQGIRDRHTFVSRTPASTQILVDVSVNGASGEMGDALPVPAAGAPATVTVRVGRGDGGLLRLIAGEAVATDAELAAAPLGSVVLEQPVVGADFTAQATLDVRPGTWVYAYVLDPLVRADLPPEQAAQVRDIARKVMETGEEDYAGLADMVVAMVDPVVFMDGAQCDRKTWKPDELQCIPADADGIATYFIPDHLDRAINVVIDDGDITDWAMGAIGSAVRFVPET